MTKPKILRITRPREEKVVVTKQVVDAFEVPVIDFNDLTLEVTKNGNVYLNGILLQGLSTDLAKRKVCGSGYSVSCKLPSHLHGTLELWVNGFINNTESDVPHDARLAETVDITHRNKK